MSKINVVKINGEKKKPTILINFILDESGSMAGQQMQVIDGFNEYIQEHQRKNDANYLITLVKFSDSPKTVFANRPVGLVEKLTPEDYSPGGWTALRDAIGSTIHIADAAMSLSQDEPKVLTFIFTDGHENASKEFDISKLKQMIKRREDTGSWTFTFIGASADCLKQASDFGISWGNSIVYNSNNMYGTISALSQATSAYTCNVTRGMSNTSTFFKDAGITSSADLDSIGATYTSATSSSLPQPGNISQEQTDNK